MSESDTPVYSTKQVADSLGLGTAMVRKYAVALEKLTGEDIPLKRRDGRQFSLEHFQTISKAKALVDSNNGLNIETALKMSLGTAELPGAAPGLVGPDRNALELTEALSAAVARGNEPLLKELQQLRLELRELQRDSLSPSKTDPGLVEPETTKRVKQLDKLQMSLQEMAESGKDGMLVRIARWLEQLLRKE